jgi:hypothetical protein
MGTLRSLTVHRGVQHRPAKLPQQASASSWSTRQLQSVRTRIQSSKAFLGGRAVE